MLRLLLKVNSIMVVNIYLQSNSVKARGADRRDYVRGAECIISPFTFMTRGEWGGWLQLHCTETRSPRHLSYLEPVGCQSWDFARNGLCMGMWQRHSISMYLSSTSTSVSVYLSLFEKLVHILWTSFCYWILILAWSLRHVNPMLKGYDLNSIRWSHLNLFQTILVHHYVTI